VNNLYDISIRHLHKKGKYKKFEYDYLTETSKNLTEQLVERLDLINEVLEDLRETKARFDDKLKDSDADRYGYAQN
jgi:predicted nucleic-acid-binding protein